MTTPTPQTFEEWWLSTLPPKENKEWWSRYYNDAIRHQEMRLLKREQFTAWTASAQASAANAEDYRLQWLATEDKVVAQKEDIARLAKQNSVLREALEFFRTAGHWGRIKAFICEGCPSHDEGIQISKGITKAQVILEEALEAAAPSEKEGEA